MFKYTFDPNLRHLFWEKKTPGTQWWNTQFRRQHAWLKEFCDDEHYNFQLMHHLKEFNYMVYAKPVKFVEVGGYLIPAKYFIMEEI